MLLAGAGVCIAVEFALDKSAINNGILYGVMMLALVPMFIAVLLDDGRIQTAEEIHDTIDLSEMSPGSFGLDEEPKPMTMDDIKATLPQAAPGEHIDMDTGEVTPKEPVPARAKAPVQAQPPVQKEERAAPNEPAPQPQQQNSQNPNAFPCPRTDGATMVTEADCEKCNQRTSCIEWAVDLPEEG